MYGYAKSWNPVGGDVESGFDDYDPDIRRGFIRKVFGLLSLQLLLTTCIGGIIIGVDSVKNYIHENIWFFWLVFFASLAFIIILACVPGLKDSYPLNLILLFAFTGCEGILIGTVAATYDLNEIILAAGITVGVTVGLTIFAVQTKFDFTMLNGILCAGLVVLVMMSFVFAFFPGNGVLSIILSAFGALLFSMYLVYDVQMIVGGRKYELGPDDYVMAALNVYLDIVNLFLYILSFVGSRD